MYAPKDMHLTSVEVWPNIGHTSGGADIANYVVIFVTLNLATKLVIRQCT